MDVSLFDFELPPERIALRPAVPRTRARLLVVEDDKLTDSHMGLLADHLRSGDVLVFNDTKVIPAQLEGVRGAREAGGGQGARISITLHKEIGAGTWRAFVKPAKRLRDGDVISISDGLTATVDGDVSDGEACLIFSQKGAVLYAMLEEVGRPPLPPYISSKREIDRQDAEDYQTVYAAHEGSVAAPTAGLHFTEELLAALKARGIETAFVTLHVGAGTFLPVKSDDTEDHVMHAEWGEISEAVAKQLNKAKGEGQRIIAVGTTAVRLLESAADDEGELHTFDAETDIFITPGYSFRFIDGMITNFHLPKSTLFMLVSAFAGLDRIKAAYAHAIKEDYRFYSYGDASLLLAKSDD